jgi:hypothetical protein
MPLRTANCPKCHGTVPFEEWTTAAAILSWQDAGDQLEIRKLRTTDDLPEDMRLAA